MSLAQAYRSQLAAKQRNQLLFCLMAAVLVHVGAIALGLAFWQQIRTFTSTHPANANAKAKPPLPLEFVYLDSPNAAKPPVKTERRSQVNEVAAGEHQSTLPINPGQSGATEKSEQAASSSSPPAVSIPSRRTAIVPQSPAPNPATQNPAIPQSPTPQSPTPQSPENRAIASNRANPSNPSSHTYNSHTNNSLQRATLPETPAQPLPILQSTRPVAPTVSTSQTPTRSSSSAPVSAAPHTAPPPQHTNSSRPTSTSSTPTTTAQPRSQPRSPASQSGAAAQLGAPLSQQVATGQGLSGAANPNRTTYGSTSVDATQDDVWGAYIAALDRKVNQSWQRISLDKGRQAKVRFVVDRQGSLAELQLVQSSGDAGADQSALQAVQTSAPFEPLPRAATEKFLVVTITFNYHVAVVSP